MMARPKSNRRVVRLSVSMDEEDHAALRKLAGALDLSTAWVVRRAVSEFIERCGDKPEAELALQRAGHRAA